MVRCFATGDEFFNWLHDEGGYTIVQDHSTGYYVYAQLDDSGDLIPTPYIAGRIDPKVMGLRPWLLPPPQKLYQIRSGFYQNQIGKFLVPAPTTGTINNIVIFIRFSDESEFTDPISTYNTMFNNSTGGANSEYNYFREVSYNSLTVSTTFYPTPATTVISYQDFYTRNYYKPYDALTNPIGYQGGDNGTQRRDREHILLKNAVNAVSPQIPPGLVVDGDGDGNVDNVCFIVSGSPTGWASLLWPHMWQLYSQTAYINGKRAWTYNFQLQTSLISSGVGVLCHEMFHSLGSPDLYHYSMDGLTPVYAWDVMEYDLNPPQHMGAYMKYRYGHWISSIPTITTSGVYALNPLVSSTNNCYKIPSPNTTTEYFVVEYRRKTGTFENSIPGSGLLVYRINTARDGQGNASGPPDEVYIYRPNGTLAVNGSPWLAHFSNDVGRTAINDSTNPSSFLSSGNPGGLLLSNVTSAGGTISFTFSTSLPCTLNVQTSPDSGATITVSPADINGAGSGPTPLSRIYNSGANVSLTAPASYDGKSFQYWKVDGGASQATQTINVNMSADHTAIAYFGVYPDIRTPITAINFGHVNVGNSFNKTTTIYNDGNAALTVNGITRTSGSTDFTYIGPAVPFNIAAGGSQVVTLRFGPASAGAKSAVFNVNSNDPDEANVTFDVSGTGVVSYPVPFSESFTGAVIPANWTTQNQGSGITERWSVSATTNSGGQLNEMRCIWQSVNPGTTRLVTPPLNTSGYSTLQLSFKHFYDDYGSGTLLKIQTSTDGVNWTDEPWSLASGGGNKGPETISTTLGHNLNTPVTYVAFVVTGDLYQFDYWYVDDVVVAAPAPASFVIPFGALNNGNINLGNIGGSTANVILRGLNASGAIVFEQNTTIPVKGVKRTWDILGNIYSYGKPLTVEVGSDQTLSGDNIKWADPPYDTVGAGFTCGPVSQMKGTLFYFPFSSFGSTSGYAVISNTTSSTANITIEVYDQTGTLKKTQGMTVGPKGVARTYESLGNIQTWADPALLKITSDQGVVVEAVRWEQNRRGWGFAIFPSAIGSGTSFLIPFGALNNGNVNLGNTGSATANVTIKAFNASGSIVLNQATTIPTMGVKRTWDIVGDIYNYGKPVTVEVTSDQALVGENIKWADPPYDTVGAGFSCAPVSLMKGTQFYFPFSSFGSVQGYAAISNTTSSTANITIEVYDQAGVLKKTQGMTVGSRGVARTWESLGNIATWADPALVKIVSDQDIIVEAVRWESNKRGWGFAILPIL